MFPLRSPIDAAIRLQYVYRRLQHLRRERASKEIKLRVGQLEPKFISNENYYREKGMENFHLFRRRRGLQMQASATRKHTTAQMTDLADRLHKLTSLPDAATRMNCRCDPPCYPDSIENVRQRGLLPVLSLPPTIPITPPGVTAADTKVCTIPDCKHLRSSCVYFRLK